MNRTAFPINGLAYFPGIAKGALHRGAQGDISGRILLINQDEITDLKALPAGFIVIDAVPFSHTMIGLLGLGVPTVLMGAEQAVALGEGMPIVIDGARGQVHDASSDVSLDHPAPSIADAVQPPVMADGEAVHLLASVRQAATAMKARQLGASAIGLVRSEFLMPEDGRVPDRAFFYQAFGDICEAASSLTVTFRLLDVAADKTPAWLPRLDASGQSLGLQGVRLYSHAPVDRVIDAQLSALQALSRDYSLRVLLPFLVRIEEYDYWLKKVRACLPDQVPVGAMAETPAMVLDIDHLLAHADFVAIGCNDLMQTLFAADRDQPEVSHYLDPYAPVLYRLFRQIAELAGDEIHRIQLCGVLSQIQGVMPLLLGLGFRDFSVDAPFIPHLARTVSKTTRAETRQLAEQVCRADTTQQVLDTLQLTGERHAPFLF